MTATASDDENPELRDMTRRFWTSVIIAHSSRRVRHVTDVAADSGSPRR